AVLSVGDIARLRQRVFGHRPVAAVEAQTGADEVPIVAVGPRELLLAGLTSNGVFTLFIVLGALTRFAEEWLPETARRLVWQGLENLAVTLGGRSWMTVLALLVGVVGGLLVVSTVVSSLLSLARFYDFRLTQHGTALRRTYGLLTRHVSNLSPARIQLIAIEQTLVRRFFGWAALRVDVAGVAYERDEEQQGRGLLAPLLERGAAERLLPRFLNDCDLDPQAWQPVSPLAIRRGIWRRSAWLVALTAGALWWSGLPYGLWPLTLFPVIIWVSWLDYRARGYIAGEAYWFVRQGWINRATYVIPVCQIQSVVVAQTPFDWRLGLATLILDTAGQTPVVIRDVPVAEAEALGRQTVSRAETAALEMTPSGG
ncbi:MAG: PH domain-containing protein, partial [Chloracidobacterium sp.]